MAPQSRALEGLRILIADDDRDSLDAVAMLLEMIYLTVEPKLDPLRADPRFPDLLRRMNLE